MKLLFAWINEDINNTIHQQGFNFNTEHHFRVLLSNNHCGYQLDYHYFPEHDVWSAGDIVGLTALIGENGVGKTSLLYFLYSSHLIPVTEESRPEYAELNKKNISMEKRILVYQMDDKIVVYHNFLSGELQNNTGFIAVNVNELNANACVSVMERLEQKTVIYLSNSNYAPDVSGYCTHVKLNRIGLTPNSLNILANSFYDKITMKTQRYIPDKFSELQSIVKSAKTSSDFQEICDICYYHSLQENQIGDISFNAKRHTKFEVSFFDIIGLIRKVPGYSKIGQPDFEAPNKEIKELDDYIISYQHWINNIGEKVKIDTLCVVCLNLIFEMCYIWNIKLPTQMINTLSDCLELIKIILSKYNCDPEKKEEQLAYYKNGQTEILLLADIIQDCPIIENIVPQTDLTYRIDRVIDSAQNIQRYNNFCTCVDSFARAKDSVVLKYIHIHNLMEMSSGERALQNLFSWLRLPPHFDEYFTTQPIPIREDILLLVDEIDLYMHPEWQRQCLKYFTNQLKLQFPGKRIQIIISTHSPLILSDVPVQNTIYLKHGKNGTEIIERNDRPQTFGANIHELLNDAFFLNNTMGAYAYGIISEISQNLLHLQKDPENQVLKDRCRPYISIIEMIGEPLIQHKLNSIYNNCFPEPRYLVIKEQLLRLPQELKASQLDKSSAKELMDALEKAAAELNHLF